MKAVEPTLVLRAGLLIDGTGAHSREDVAVVINGNRIAEIGGAREVAIPPGARVVDLEHRTLMPGLIDAHMHLQGAPSDQPHVGTDNMTRVLRAAGEAKKMLEAGITAARCLGSPVSPALRRAIEDGHVPGPRLVTAGEFICSTAGTWDDIGIPLDVIKSGRDMFADGVDAVREAVRNRIRSGANVIKVGLSKGEVGDQYGWGDDPYKMSVSYSPEEIRALTDEAHLNKLKVSAHCVGEESVRSAIQNGVDVIEHGFGISDETRKMLVDLNMTVVSTLSMLYFEKAAEEPYHYPQWRRTAIRRHTDAQRADWEKGLEAGVRFALGSDLIGYPVAPQDEAAKEFEIAVQWGMDPMAAIVAGTKVSAEVLGLDAMIGTIEVGKAADLIAVEQNPLTNISALQQVSFVVHDGGVVVDKTVGNRNVT